LKNKDARDRLKYEAASELGLADKVNRVGWGNLTSKEAGRIGALVAGRNRKRKDKDGGDTP
jgi:small acid-soluble spore protein F (minor alpha/beta-type SASP)